jgi:Mrp family chromosome partitioning ATPase
MIDSPPVLPVADALTIAPHCSGVVFAVSIPDADRRSVATAIGLLKHMGIRLLGTVGTNLERSRRSAVSCGYGYVCGYGYGYGEPERRTAGVTPAVAGTDEGRSGGRRLPERGASH